MKVRFISLASGSSGNCYYIGTEKYGILIDAGIAVRTIKKGLKEAGINMEMIRAVFVTHDHADHVGDAVAICRHTGARLGAIVGTAQKLEAAGVPSAQLLNYIGFNMGGTVAHAGFDFTLTQSSLSSESCSPAGYIFRTPDGKLI